MTARFEDLINGMLNVGFGAAVTASEKSREVLHQLNDKGERVRSQRSESNFARSMAQVFEQAGGTISDVTATIGATGETAAERILDELIRARVRPMDARGRIAFIEHVRSLVNSIDDTARAGATPAGAPGEAGTESAGPSSALTGSAHPADPGDERSFSAGGRA
ncbi:hypothetical protein Corgl_1156 [Coriobacterium glomerans PW2]|uniref:Uncharacterized protein n=1 Tax=Coriobacterium glomerans (strain ATCC 49209 / DSM 20642 / JCM 10262 / PW2) TaxID=700015 RepID=F2N879_CORGP|nr:hypothetical protein [Coriobacterium glomerans]AEB07262.1 hypothetical protein Corgl_1156 [Coriobacterium glomerans PW2]